MNLVSPKLPDYDVAEWQRRPFAERVRLACQAWAADGYGTPLAVYGFYLLKIAAYVGAWFFFCSRSAALGAPGEVSGWWFELEALQRAVLWSMLYEGLGFGCGSGPLTGRYVPPFTAFLHFARPGTTKMPLFAGLPLLGGWRRTWLDAGLYVAHAAFLLRALLSPTLTPELLLPTAVLLPILGLADKTLFLSARAEHYYVALLCFLFPSDALAGAKTVWLAIWLWAAFSKLNRHFPAVICVMTSNSPFMPGFVRRRMYRDFPRDLRPSRLAQAMAHAGTVTELSFPVLLATSSGGTPTVIGLCIMLGFHIYITSNVPMAVPIEWNVVMVYGAFVLFGHHAAVRVFDVHSAGLALVLVTALLVVPLVGNLVPKWTSFLMAMRYYAGNWAYGIWLFRGEASKKLDADLCKAAGTVPIQLARFYDETTIAALMSKVLAFRHMHLHGRALHEVVPQAVDDIDAYEWYDGEMVAGLVLGWNFGDGHLHDEQLIEAVQAQCRFAPGELRCILVESQPFLRPFMEWRIVDAAQGQIAQGRVSIDALLAADPWPSAESG